MKKRDVEELERVSGQLDGLHSEIGALARKSPNDAANKFKLRFINNAIISANRVLGPDYIPCTDFEQFDEDDLPTYSDAMLVLSQYIEQIERKRSDNIEKRAGVWYYSADDDSNIRTAPPKKIQERK